jgi:hypothetical protein
MPSEGISRTLGRERCCAGLGLLIVSGKSKIQYLLGLQLHLLLYFSGLVTIENPERYEMYMHSAQIAGFG